MKKKATRLSVKKQPVKGTTKKKPSDQIMARRKEKV
jgi:hypothetical protein